ncbi:MAG TPA: hypothetical protein VHR72_13445 [Gemmataceae bacterium]|jgi:hypothetical protein|nr:hypothetical protein [Gemmataceae bacterium]
MTETEQTPTTEQAEPAPSHESLAEQAALLAGSYCDEFASAGCITGKPWEAILKPTGVISAAVGLPVLAKMGERIDKPHRWLWDNAQLAAEPHKAETQLRGPDGQAVRRNLPPKDRDWCAAVARLLTLLALRRIAAKEELARPRLVFDAAARIRERERLPHGDDEDKRLAAELAARFVTVDFRESRLFGESIVTINSIRE